MILSSIISELSSITIEMSSDVLVQELEGETVLLDMRNGEYFGINSTGSKVWKDMSNGVGLIDIVDSISDSFDLDRALAATDVLSFVRRLGGAGLVKIIEDFR